MFDYVKKTVIGKRISNVKRALITYINPTLATRKLYFNNFNVELNLKNPQSLNEKIQYLKLYKYYNDKTITNCIDKLKVKDYLKQIGYGDLVVPLIAEYDSADKIAWESLPDSFVIKCNHGCGYNYIIKNKSDYDELLVKKTINDWMREEYWLKYAEVQYRFIEKKILVEELLNGDLLTYKFYCFNGKPKILYISKDGENGEKDLYVDYYDMDLKKMDITLGNHLHNREPVEKPLIWGEMIRIVEDLCAEFPFVRIDLYVVNNQIYFSEYTFVPTGGFMHLKPKSIDTELGAWLSI